ncbi:MAG TPA: hypothetical protein VGE47_13630 [Burkholderiaceae bacterium]
MPKLLLVVVLGSLGLGSATANDLPDVVRQSVPQLSCAGGAYGTRLPKGLSALRALGRIRDEQILRVEKWDGYTAIEKMIRFDGLYVQVITFSNDPERYNLAGVFIESSRWDIAPIRVGQPAAPLLARLGAKNTSRDATVKFTGESDSLFIESRAGKVFRVVYDCYTG